MQSIHSDQNVQKYFQLRQEGDRALEAGVPMSCIASTRKCMLCVDPADNAVSAMEMQRVCSDAQSHVLALLDLQKDFKVAQSSLPCFGATPLSTVKQEHGASCPTTVRKELLKNALKSIPATQWLAEALDESGRSGKHPLSAVPTQNRRQQQQHPQPQQASHANSINSVNLLSRLAPPPKAAPIVAAPVDSVPPPPAVPPQPQVQPPPAQPSQPVVHPFFQNYGKKPPAAPTSAASKQPLPHRSEGPTASPVAPHAPQFGGSSRQYAPAQFAPPAAPAAPPQQAPPSISDDPALQACGQSTGFITAAAQHEKDVKAGRVRNQFAGSNPGPTKRLGLGRQQPFVPPLLNRDDDQNAANKPTNPTGIDKVMSSVVNGNTTKGGNNQKRPSGDGDEDDASLIPPELLNEDGSLPEKLEGLDPKLIAAVAMEILKNKGSVTWNDIAGLQHAKRSVEEAIVWPLARPDLFHGLRDPPKGLLLFGPPGTGKTMIARAIASQANCTFMSISASSLMSKWVGEGEKMVRCMFAVANVKQPTVIFIDEIDSLLSMRSEGEMDAVRRVKTEFLVQLDGVGTSGSDRILVIGATNRPEELDEAARRRMEKRLYIPLPDFDARRHLMSHVLRDTENDIAPSEFDALAQKTDGYSCADLHNVAREAAMAPLRENARSIANVSTSDIRPVKAKDFLHALRRVKTSVGKSELVRHEQWNDEFGSFPVHGEEEEDDDI